MNDIQKVIEYFEKEKHWKSMALSPILEGKASEQVQYIEIAISAMQELQEYREIGLTPAQIREIDKLYQEKCRELAAYKKLEEQGRLLKFPAAIGSKVYEIIEETVPEHYFYIDEYEVQDLSATAVKYCNDWIPFDYDMLYFTREAAEAELTRKKEKDNGK